ncbi:glutaredoxin family protein [Crystallibacter degradans]|uniref:glutaredoxin family protein n=1 Tax=Crystallibacter degradans TaxID=2726743 RepID=UPI001474D8E7|nr:glutaredoxin family protein [Arthrobacter sp. SF27]NMR32465.1 glutaredoxin family protein [Arthrobacter sp. SF27]
MTTPTYTKPGCFPCRKTIEKFQDAGIEPHVVDLTETPAALDYVSEELGYSQAPIVVIDDDFHWSGLNPDCIQRAIHALTHTTD